MKRIIHIVFLIALSFSLKAQMYNNEWINFSNKYYKFPIAKTGFYRIDSATLAKSGINLSAINPKNFQLFIKGKEQHVYIKGDADNVFNASDYLEFFAEKNDGRFDSSIYNGITYMPNPYVSLFSDTIHAFLTWNNITSNKRLVLETDTASSSYSPAPYYYREFISAYKIDYNQVEEFAFDAADPHYTQAEGYGNNINNGGSFTTNIPNLNMYTVTPLPVNIKISFSGASVNSTVMKDHEVKGVIYNAANTPVTLFDTVFKGYRPFLYTFSLTSTALGNNSNIQIASINNPIFTGVSNVTNLHYIYYKFPQLPILGGTSYSKLFVEDDAAFTKTYLKLSGANTGTTNSVVFYDVTNNKRIESVINAGFVKVLVPNSGGQKTCYIDAESNVIKVDTLKPVNNTGYFKYYKSATADSAYVIISASKLMTEANNYAAYRQSVAGGLHNVIVADVEELYDQFAFGIKKHPKSIRSFCRYLMDSLPSIPKNVFLIGRAVQHREMITQANAWPKSELPSMGIPPSDNLYTAGLKSTDIITPEIPIGRLAAQTATQVADYLAKVQQHESTSGVDWRKHVLHLAGGNDAGQQAQFQAYLANYKSIIQDTLYGGKVFDFKKTTTAPIQITISDSVKNHFNYGVGLVTFFGHGSVTGFDQAIDDPEAYNNTGKYPLMIANSCYSGNIHTINLISNSEKFVLAKQKGTIAFIAATSLGFVSTLNYYTNSLYRALGYSKYNKGIGEIVQDACRKSSQSFGNYLQQFTALDMALHGDPAVKISVGRFPDYFIDNSRVSFDLKTHVDSIGILVDVSNLGRAQSDSMIVKVERYYANNDSVTFYKKMQAPFYRDTLKFFMPIDYNRGLGLNKFKVFVDAYSTIAEENENNNKTTGTVDVFIQGGDLVPVYPYQYAVLPSTPTITLKASTSDPFAASRNYRLQLDTTDLFISPIQQTVIQSRGGVVEWTVNLPFADSTVYFWRVSKDSTGPSDGFVWRESSFQTITNKHGWGQSHFFQFKNDGFQFVKYKRPIRQFVFENDRSSLFCRTGMLSVIDFANIVYSINGSVKHTWCCTMDGWSIAVFDSISTKPWVANATATNAPVTGPFGNCLCVDNTQLLYAFDFGGGPSACAPVATWKTNLENFLNGIPQNNMVLAYSTQRHYSSTFPNSLYSAFESFGSGNIRTVKDTTPIIIFGRKGMSPGQAHEVVAPNSTTQVSLNDTLKTRWNSGFIASELIGPGYKWNSLHWKVRSLDAVAGDSTFVKVIGIRKNGQIDTLVMFKEDSTNVLDLYNYADANTYPFLKLVAFKKDNVNRTSPQLKYWYVLYDEAPECAINPKKGFVAINDTMQEGDNFSIVLPVENIGQIPFTDSLVFTYWIEDANRVVHPYPQKLKTKPFNPGQLILDTIKINSYQYPGNNALWVDVNPPQNARYQKEQFRFNNVARYAFSVSRDITNPLLDVTFDGIRIMNGDIVSAKPSIIISLKDENKFLALNDTASFTLYLKKPSDLQEKKVPFASGLNFTPAQLPSNSCKIEYNATFAEDGKYSFIVQAKDRSNNQSGAIDYRITFEVVNKPSITQVINYPNPFSTSTRFVFNLTGSEVPDMFNIQIMTITGKIVKTITKDELGPLHIGRNITQYAWDGKDDFGDKLGNGVYLYKVQTKINGQSIEHKSTEADQYFTKELGKMVIMR